MNDIAYDTQSLVETIAVKQNTVFKHPHHMGMAPFTAAQCKLNIVRPMQATWHVTNFKEYVQFIIMLNKSKKIKLYYYFQQI